MNKRGITQIKAVFLILNLVIAMLAFSWVVSCLPGHFQMMMDEGANRESTKAVQEEAKVAAKTQSSTKTPTSSGVKGIKVISGAGGSGANIISDGGSEYLVQGEMKAGEEFDAIDLSTGKTETLKVGDDVIRDAKPASKFQTKFADKMVKSGGKEMSLASKDLNEWINNPPDGYSLKKLKNGNVKMTNSEGITTTINPDTGNVMGTGRTWGSALKSGIIQDFMGTLMMAGTVYMILSSIKGEDAGIAGAAAVTAGKLTYQVLKKKGVANAGWWGIGVGIAVFVFMYKEKETEVVEFNCQPWEAPIGGDDCELCNEFKECTEYTCKSLGQACDLVEGEDEKVCVWKNPHDTTSPRIKMKEVLEGYEYEPDESVRPPATGVEISKEDGGCVEAFTSLEFTIETDEPSQCRIDYNLTSSNEDNPRAAYEDMAYSLGGSNAFKYNHTEKMSLPGPDNLDKLGIKNDGDYTLYMRCQDANGNFNQDPYSVNFCVDAGPDTTPPLIEKTSLSSESPIQFNQSTLDLEVYVNEPAECKWSRENMGYEYMENNMSCSLNIWEMNAENTYTCATTLTGIKNRQENKYYFRCKDNPQAENSERNENKQSFLYKVIGTQPLNIMEVKPNETIKDSTDTVPVFLEIETDNGYDNGEAVCYYTTEEGEGKGDEDEFLKFSNTSSDVHRQRQDLPEGEYTYYIKCVDMANNADYNSTSFRVETDSEGPVIVRAYKEGGQLKVITNENAECKYSHKDCNFDLEEQGIEMESIDYKKHFAEWETDNYYIRCRDEYGNEPNPNTCSMVVKPYEVVKDTVEL